MVWCHMIGCGRLSGMAYFLIVIVVAIFFTGVAQLAPLRSHRTPRTALIVWAILFAAGAERDAPSIGTVSRRGNLEAPITATREPQQWQRASP